MCFLAALRICLALVLLLKESHCIDYCQLSSDHVMCLYPKGGTFGNCRLVPMTRKRKKDILHAFNSIRNEAACGDLPADICSLSKARMLEWDSTLQVFAERWASQCQKVSQNDEFRQKSEGMPVGQNVGGTSGAYLDVVYIVEKWYQDWRLSYDPQAEGDLMVTSNFKNLMYDDASAVGCGLVDRMEDSDQSNDTDYPRSTLVCNIERGYVSGEYAECGNPRSKCPGGWNKQESDYPCLCVESGRHRSDRSSDGFLPAPPRALLAVAVVAAIR